MGFNLLMIRMKKFDSTSILSEMLFLGSIYIFVSLVIKCIFNCNKSFELIQIAMRMTINDSIAN